MRANDGTRTGGEILIDQLVAHGVQHRTPGGGLGRETGEAAGVGDVHGRPAVAAVAHVRRHTTLAGSALSRTSNNSGVPSAVYSVST